MAMRTSEFGKIGTDRGLCQKRSAVSDDSRVGDVGERDVGDVPANSSSCGYRCVKSLRTTHLARFATLSCFHHNSGMRENEIAAKILDAAFRVHTELGPGLLESVYETALAWELVQMGFNVERQRAIPLVYRDIKLEDGFRVDLLVEGQVIVEIKSLEQVPTVAFKILLTYLRLADIRLGLMINFGEEHLKDGIKRVANRL